MAQLLSGTEVGGKYVLERLIGEGGMGAVWVGRDKNLDREVAVKFMHTGPGATERSERFVREARALARLRSPHVVQIYDEGVHEGIPYLVMELLAGEDLEQRLAQRGRLSLPQAARIVTQVTDALAAAHEHGVIHRDLKPSNIFLAREGGREVVKLLDFGIAKLLDAPSAMQTGPLAMGTPVYMSPEQVTGSSGLDGRSDLWSLATVLYHALTGRLPFDEGASTYQILRQIDDARFAPPSRFVPELGPEVDRFFARALARDRNVRFQSATELREAFLALPGAAASADEVLAPQKRSPAPPAPTAAPSPAPSPAVSAAANSLLFSLKELRGPRTDAIQPLGTSAVSAEAPLPGAGFERLAPAPRTDPWALFADVLPDALPDAFAAQAVPIAAFLQALFGRCAPMGEGLLRLHEPRVPDGETYQFFAIFVADRGADRLLTRTFIHYAAPLERQLAQLDPSVPKVVLAIIDSLELGAGVRQQIFEFHQRHRALVLPLHVGEIAGAAGEGGPAALFHDRLADFHSLPDVFAAGARSLDPTGFFGMRRLVNELVRILQEGTPLVALSGPPGSGKTAVLEMVRYGLKGVRLVRVRSIESPERSIDGLTRTLCRALAGAAEAAPETAAAPADDVPLGERLARAAELGRDSARASGEKLLLALEDADWCLGALTDPRAPEDERLRARAFWVALGDIAQRGLGAVIVTGLSGYLLGEPLLLGWANPLANRVRLAQVEPMSFPEVEKMLRELGRQMNVVFEPAALRRVYELAAGNVYVVRKLSSQALTPLRRAPGRSPLAEIRIRPADIERAARDLAAVGSTFQASVIPWLGPSERQVLEVVAVRRPRTLHELTRALAGHQSPEDAGAALERLRRMGLIERQDGRERLAIPLLEAWAQKNLTPAPSEVERRRRERLFVLSSGLTLSLLLFGGYWLWSQPGETVLSAGACRYTIDHPSRVTPGAPLQLYVFRDCATGQPPPPVVLSAADTTYALFTESKGPALDLDLGQPPGWRQREVEVVLKDLGHSRFQFSVAVGGAPSATLVLGLDWMARIPGALKALLALAGALPGALGMILAFHREVLGLVRRLVPGAAEERDAASERAGGT